MSSLTAHCCQASPRHCHLRLHFLSSTQKGRNWLLFDTKSNCWRTTNGGALGRWLIWLQLLSCPTILPLIRCLRLRLIACEGQASLMLSMATIARNAPVSGNLLRPFGRLWRVCGYPMRCRPPVSSGTDRKSELLHKFSMARWRLVSTQPCCSLRRWSKPA